YNPHRPCYERSVYGLFSATRMARPPSIPVVDWCPIIPLQRKKIGSVSKEMKNLLPASEPRIRLRHGYGVTGCADTTDLGRRAKNRRTGGSEKFRLMG